MGEREQRSGRETARVGVAVVVSLVLHLVFLALALPAGLPWAPPGPDTPGDVILVTTEESRPSKHGHTATPPSTDDVRDRQHQDRRAKRVRLSTSTEATELPSEQPGEDEEAASSEAVDSGEQGGGRDDGDGLDLTPRLTTMIGVFDVPHECRDLIDNDGDHLIDYEDPECRVPETREEAVEINTEAMLLSDMRSNDIPRGDPDELARKRIQWSLQPTGDHLAYQDGSFGAKIAPDGSVVFDRGKRGAGLGFSFDTTPRNRRNLHRKSQFLEATEEIRDQRDTVARARFMKEALANLESDLDELWRDRRFSLSQKRSILFQRLDECDTDTQAGRQAAKIIVDFIRARSFSASNAP